MDTDTHHRDTQPPPDDDEAPEEPEQYENQPVYLTEDGCPEMSTYDLTQFVLRWPEEFWDLKETHCHSVWDMSQEVTPKIRGVQARM